MFSNENKDNIIEMKGILLGDFAVGKTSLINVSIGKKFDPSERAAIAPNFSKKKIAVNGQEYCINFWDTWGLERLKTLSKIFFKGSQIVIFVYDITSKNSFIRLRKWVEDVENIINNEYICGIVGNKQDLYSEEEVNEEDAKEFANSKGMKFKLVSAKEDPKGFNDFLEELLNDGIKYFERKKLLL